MNRKNNHNEVMYTNTVFYLNLPSNKMLGHLCKHHKISDSKSKAIVMKVSYKYSPTKGL